jgi:hypothetical protein
MKNKSTKPVTSLRLQESQWHFLLFLLEDSLPPRSEDGHPVAAEMSGNMALLLVLLHASSLLCACQIVIHLSPSRLLLSPQPGFNYSQVSTSLLYPVCILSCPGRS